MKILIIEDEQPAFERLQKMIHEIVPGVQLLAQLTTVKSAVEWFQNNSLPDLVMLDINLADGSSFEIFKQIKLSCPVIFTTAYDQYAIDAFKLNSVDYLLKPVKKEELKNAIDKYKQNFSAGKIDVEAVIRQLSTPRKDAQKRIMIRIGDMIKIVEVDNVAYFYTEDKINYLCTFDNLRYPVDYNLDEIDEIINAESFFRINRQFIVNIKAIEKMLAWSKSRVKLILKPASDQETIVSTERSPHFKEWLTGKPDQKNS